MKFNEPKVEFIQIDFKNSFIMTSSEGCLPNNGNPGGGWHCSNSAWSYDNNNCGDAAAKIC